MIEKTYKFRLNIEIVDPSCKPYRSIILCIWEKSNDPDKDLSDCRTKSYEDDDRAVIEKIAIGQCISAKNIKFLISVDIQ
jgi:hypothetical protein